MSIPRKIRCTVESIVDHGGRVYTVELKPERPVPAFLSGQFLHLTVDDFDPAGFWPESRVFSIASSPAERGRIKICYSVKGRYTQKMERVLAAGSNVWIKLPYGEFVIQSAGEVVLIAGGTGISAFTAFVAALTPENQQKVTLVYGARTPELLLFKEMILDQFAKVARLNIMFFTETPDDGFFRRMAALPRVPACFVGRISIDTVLRQQSIALCPPTSVFGSPASDLRPLISGPDPLPPVFYLAGPPVMISALSAGLRTCGVGTERIRIDAWE
jgi:NAD(P)H-flavin reductase